MGFFSELCPGCKHSIRARCATNDVSRWMAQAVVLFENGDRVSGEYDGYGDVGDHEESIGMGETESWHRACWNIAGKPEFTKPSGHAADQGFFVGEYDPVEPRNADDLAALKEHAETEARVRREKAKRERLAHIAELEAKGEPVPEWLRPRSSPQASE